MKLIKSIDVLGTEYKIYQLESKEENGKELNSWEAGHCRGIEKVIMIAYMDDVERFGTLENVKKEFSNEVLRHEIVHAFLNESGLRWNSNNSTNGWAENEEMVDWFAIQSPKIFKIYQELNIL